MQRQYAKAQQFFYPLNKLSLWFKHRQAKTITVVSCRNKRANRRRYFFPLICIDISTIPRRHTTMLACLFLKITISFQQTTREYSHDFRLLNAKISLLNTTVNNQELLITSHYTTLRLHQISQPSQIFSYILTS